MVWEALDGLILFSIAYRIGGGWVFPSLFGFGGFSWWRGYFWSSSWEIGEA